MGRVSRGRLAPAWISRTGPDDGPWAIDPDCSSFEKGGVAKEGVCRHHYASQRDDCRSLAIAVRNGDVRREGRSPHGPADRARFLRATVGRVRHAGAKGQFIRRSRTGRQRVLHQRLRRRLPQDDGPLFDSQPPAPEPARSHRVRSQGQLDAHALRDGRRYRRD